MRTVWSYRVFVISCFVAFIVNVSLFFLQVELQPVVQTHDLLPVFGLPDENVFKSTRVLTRKATQ